MEHQFKIAILLPTRGRTDALSRSVISLVNRAVDLDTVQLMLGFDNDDKIGFDHFTEHLQPWLDQRGVNYTAMMFERMGYRRLNEYVNALAVASDADWMVFWNDDAIMDTSGWDREIAKYTGQFKLLAVHTHKDHPYSIFPIAPANWFALFGYLSPHQISDAWLSQQAYMLDIFERINVYVTHDRHDLTGNNNDDTLNEGGPSHQNEGNPNDPRDFHHPSWSQRRTFDCERLATYMKSIELDTTWWENIKRGTQDPWEKLKINDVNQQMKQYSVKFK
jgi:hypothetical protein